MDRYTVHTMFRLANMVLLLKLLNTCIAKIDSTDGEGGIIGDMDGWMEGWICGWVDRWMDVCEDGVCRDDLGGYLNNRIIQIRLH